ncbi:hypothetical protein BJ878DRAFT_574884 [Calycina marina]|uniref:Uncharacterized protein n=1 Tax=Calycina marina TaxID=1763456 RepID=A0A9P8CFQ6_9HELO|nr:hypothetical protein BJ878DRAFT_574884 [Calycina marina]
MSTGMSFGRDDDEFNPTLGQSKPSCIEQCAGACEDEFHFVGIAFQRFTVQFITATAALMEELGRIKGINMMERGGENMECSKESRRVAKASECTFQSVQEAETLNSISKSSSGMKPRKSLMMATMRQKEMRAKSDWFYNERSDGIESRAEAQADELLNPVESSAGSAPPCFFPINLLASSPFERYGPRYYLSDTPDWIYRDVSASNRLSKLSPLEIRSSSNPGGATPPLPVLALYLYMVVIRNSWNLKW